MRMAAASMGLVSGRWLGAASAARERRLSYLDMPQHDPVMLAEILRLLPLQPGGVAVDCTLGLGGHSAEMMKRISPGGTLIGFDWDASMLRIAEDRLASQASALHVKTTFVNDSFASVAEHLDRMADGILMDLGLN